MKRKASLAIAIVVVLAASIMIGYYVESHQNSKSPSGTPSLVYDFSSTILFNYQTEQYYGGSFLGWDTSGGVFENLTDAVAINPSGALSRQFKAVGPNVEVSFDWSNAMTLIVHRQLDGVYTDIDYAKTSQPGYSDVRYTYNTSFNVDNGTAFTVDFTSSLPYGLLYQVTLSNSAEFP